VTTPERESQSEKETSTARRTVACWIEISGLRGAYVLVQLSFSALRTARPRLVTLLLILHCEAQDLANDFEAGEKLGPGDIAVIV
jgi:hypothetical protein